MYFKARKLVSKGCIYHLVRVNHSSAEAPSLQLFPIVKELHDDLPGGPLEGEINFSIDIIPDIQAVSTPPYIMTPIELKELKEHLKDLFDKGFILPSVPP